MSAKNIFSDFCRKVSARNPFFWTTLKTHVDEKLSLNSAIQRSMILQSTISIKIFESQILFIDLENNEILKVINLFLLFCWNIVHMKTRENFAFTFHSFRKLAKNYLTTTKNVVFLVNFLWAFYVTENQENWCAPNIFIIIPCSKWKSQA